MTKSRRRQKEQPKENIAYWFIQKWLKDLATICKVGMVMLPRAVLRMGWKGVESPRMPNESYFLVEEKLPRKLCQVEKGPIKRIVISIRGKSQNQGRKECKSLDVEIILYSHIWTGVSYFSIFLLDFLLSVYFFIILFPTQYISLDTFPVLSKL